MEFAAAYRTNRGWVAEDVHTKGRGHDLLSQGPNNQVRYIEVKGRAGAGAVELSANEWLKAEQLGQAYLLYVVSEALESPTLHLVPDPFHRLSAGKVTSYVRY